MIWASTISPKGGLFVALLWICIVGFLEFHLWRGKLAPLKTSAFRRTTRLIIYGPLGLLTLVIALVSIRPVWDWYSTTNVMDLFSLGILATGAITAWAGSLVAFTISQRVTPRRTFGLRLLSFALLISLLPMGLNGAALRSAFLMIAITSAIIGSFQASLIKATKETKFVYGATDAIASRVNLKQGTPSISTHSVEAFSDWVVSVVHGGRYWIAVAFGALAVFVFPLPRVITAIAAIALLWGMRLLYRSIVEPFTPQFLGDALDQWRKEHFAKYPPEPTPPAIGEPPTTNDNGN